MLTTLAPPLRSIPGSSHLQGGTRSGQEEDGNPSPEYLAAARNAIAAVTGHDSVILHGQPQLAIGDRVRLDYVIQGVGARRFTPWRDRSGDLREARPNGMALIDFGVPGLLYPAPVQLLKKVLTMSGCYNCPKNPPCDRDHWAGGVCQSCYQNSQQDRSGYDAAYYRAIGYDRTKADLAYERSDKGRGRRTLYRRKVALLKKLTGSCQVQKIFTDPALVMILTSAFKEQQPSLLEAWPLLTEQQRATILKGA